MVYNIMVAGEASVGKSSLIQKFSNPSYTLPADNSEDPLYFYSSTPPASATATVSDAKVNITEVPGSRGRMPNYHTVVARAATGKASSAAACFLLFFSRNLPTTTQQTLT